MNDATLFPDDVVDLGVDVGDHLGDAGADAGDVDDPADLREESPNARARACAYWSRKRLIGG